MTNNTKVMTFWFNNEPFRLKFLINNCTIFTVDKMIRQRFTFSSNQIYYLVDKSDTATICLDVLAVLPNESNLLIQLANSSSNDIPPLASTEKNTDCDMFIYLLHM